MLSDKIFKKDVTGKIRVWSYEVGEDENEGYWRTISGILHGEMITSEWKYAQPKSQPTKAQQAYFNAKAEMEKKLKVDYRSSIQKTDEERNSVIRPMLANDYVGWVGPCFAQPKLDGMRCLANSAGLWSRNNRKIISTPHIEGELKEFFKICPNIVLDGELYSGTFKNNFNMIMSLCKKTKPEFEDLELSKQYIQYWIYDMYDLNNPKLKYSNRLSFLKNMIYTELIVQVPTFEIKTEEELNVNFVQLLDQGFEGQIVRLNSKYLEKRTSNLLKRKEFKDEEFELLDILEGEGNWEGYAKIAVCQMANDKRFRAGISGTQEFTLQLLKEKDKYSSVTVKYQALTPDGVPRFPIATRFWENEIDAIEERIISKRKDLFA